MRKFLAEHKQKLATQVLQQEVSSVLDKGGLDLAYMEKLRSHYLSGADMTHETVWKSNKCAGDLLAVALAIISYIKVS